MRASFHHEAELWAAAAVAGDLTETEFEAWSSHVAACAACKKMNDEEITMSHLIKTTLDPECPDPGFEQRILHRLGQTRVGKGNRWYEYLLFHPALASAAAGLALAAIVGGGRLVHGNKAASASSTLPTPPAELAATIQSAPPRQADEKASGDIERNEESAPVRSPSDALAANVNGAAFPGADGAPAPGTKTNLAVIPLVGRNAASILANQYQSEGVGKPLDNGEANRVSAGAIRDSQQPGFQWNEGGVIRNADITSTALLGAAHGIGNVRLGQGASGGEISVIDNETGHRHRRHRRHHHHRHHHHGRHQVQASPNIIIQTNITQ